MSLAAPTHNQKGGVATFGFDVYTIAFVVSLIFFFWQGKIALAVGRLFTTPFRK